MTKHLFTVGHSNLSLEEFIRLVKKHQVNAIADVRSHPYSSYLSHFNRDLLKFELLKAKFKYVFLGDELGARPKDLSCYINNKAVYSKIADSNDFQNGIKRIVVGLNKYRVALMCAEKDPISCHRTILICKHLRQLDIEIDHIIDDKTLESQGQIEDRLLDLHGFDLQHNRLKIPKILQLDLFSSVQSSTTSFISKEEFLEKAYLIQENKIAYKNK
ncbi:MAG: DUF488 domain-containing protein [Pleurocapsa sp. SU_5_0]|nr:DUF488 domain-containing protein [Pleurocapsa sp. SU_5_0]